jgi:hypothetical protein
VIVLKTLILINFSYPRIQTEPEAVNYGRTDNAIDKKEGKKDKK